MINGQFGYALLSLNFDLFWLGLELGELIIRVLVYTLAILVVGICSHEISAKLLNIVEYGQFAKIGLYF